jgi:OmcA/MtrC family decaheme c-type cytochrome
VDPEKCKNCHDALATTFHSPDRGGSVVNCRICHTTLSGGSHLELQSRSIDSYIHAIHSFQPFDPGDIDFADPVEAMHYDHHVGSTYPNFTLLNCESCHNPGMYEVPDQGRSLPGLLSATDANATWTREIGALPATVTGPATRACGACHKARYINGDLAGALDAFNDHTSRFGYMVVNGTGVLDAVIADIMSIFGDTDYPMPEE